MMTNAITPLLEIQNLHASIEEDGTEILKGIELTIRPGEVHAIMGPNGSGKSTLAHVLSGRPGYTVTQGGALFLGKDLLAMPAEIRAREGVFLAFQYPVEIPGVSNTYFLRTAVNTVRKHRGQPELDAIDFLALLDGKAKLVEMEESLLNRSVNEGFSGGEKKRNEVLQMAILDPKLAILDETDSGLDIDALRIAAAGVNALRDGARGMLVITHYQRLLDYIVPDHVHVLSDGKIVKSGDKNLAIYTSPTNQIYPVGVNLGHGDTGLFRQCVNGPTGCGGGSTPGSINTCTGINELTGTGLDRTNPGPNPLYPAEPGACGANNREGGGTGWLVTQGNVKGGETITLRIALWDTSDEIYDSAAIIDNFQWSVDAAQPGTVIP